MDFDDLRMPPIGFGQDIESGLLQGQQNEECILTDFVRSQ